MRKILLPLVAIFALALLWEPYAEARRFGGGRSFGSRPLYQRSAPAPATPQRSTEGYQRQEQQPGQAGRQGLFGGGRGLFGGLLMGGLIGSLLFGGQGGSGPGLLDFLVIGGGLFLLFRYLAARRMATESARAMSYEASPPIGEQRGGGGSSFVSPDRTVPPGFDEAEFLAGARAAYVRLQSSWDKRDLEDIRQFTSDEVWEEIRRQAEEDPTPGYTGVVQVKAQLLEVKTVGDQTVATVHFDALLREKSEEAAPEEVQEIWHFSRKESGPESFWRLEGIQQVGE